MANLIESELRTPLDFVDLAQEAARRFDEMTLEPSQKQALIDAARSVLRPCCGAPMSASACMP